MMVVVVPMMMVMMTVPGIGLGLERGPEPKHGKKREQDCV
jgi:hypothetical protein